MQIKLAEQLKILGTAPIYTVFEGDSIFKPGILCVGEDKVFIYCDQKPDELVNDIGTYHIKFQYSFKNIICITNERIRKNPAVRGYKRLNIRHHDDNKTINLYYRIDSEKYVLGVLNLLKRRRVKVKNKKVDASRIF